MDNMVDGRGFECFAIENWRAANSACYLDLTDIPDILL